jgi:iron complex outermembrane receptor protein
MDSNTARRTLSPQLAAFLGSTSLVAVTSAMPATAQEMVAQADDIPETVLITGSLIRGTAAVGVPVTNLSPADFAMVGALTTADLFRSFPAANVLPNSVATNSGATIERGVKVNLRGLDTGTATRSLMMIDGIRFPGQGNGQCVLDPSIIPALSIDHIDVLVDGASATYGSDAVGGVINIILKRNMDGAITQLRWTTAAGGKNRYLASAVWGRTWDGGQVTISYEWFDETPTVGKNFSMFGTDHRPWGFDDRRPLGSSIPGTLSTGSAARPGGPNPPGPSGDQVGTSAVLGSGCTNCYAIPLGMGQNWDPLSTGIGPLAKPLGQPGVNPYGLNLINWADFTSNAGNSGTNGLRNQFDPYDISYYDAHQARNGGHITVDQRLTANISFYGDAFYSNRRGKFVNPGNLGPSASNAMNNVAIPTFNPYYPVGGAPNNLRVAYHMGIESPGITSFYELAQRYSLGLNIALPAGWSGRVYYSMTRDANYNIVRGDINKNAVSAALGWTMSGAPAAGTTPAIATWAKPANVPYLNLFCDPLQYICNSESTIGYISNTIRNFDQKFIVNEKGGVFDGPLFDLPGGEVKMAVGGSYTTFNNATTTIDNTGAPTLLLPYQQTSNKRAVWAVFTQINIPVFSDQNGFLGMRRLDLEFSWRHDQYSDVGGTSNPKVAFNWSPINDFMIRGTWGTSFRAPAFGELSPLANVAIAGQNLPAFAAQATPITAGCVGGLPPEGSGAWKLMSSLGPGGDGTPGTATSCPTGNVLLGSYTANFQELPGISMNGGSGAAAPIRAGGGWDGSWSGLTPELATNWGIGFDYTPTGNFLTGLNLQATYYIIKLNAVLRGFGNPTSDSFNDPTLPFAFLVPTDYANNPNLPGSAACTSNLLPTTCQPFQDAVTGLLNNPRATVDPQAKTLIMWINDGGTFNKGWIKLDGIDFSASYDWDWGDIGAFNAGIVGTYYLHRKDQAVPGGVVQDDYHTTLNAGQPNESNGVQSQNAGQMRYRARLGWSNGPWSLTGFMDYRGHYFTTQSPPPNVNGNFCADTPSGLDQYGNGGTFPCPIQNFSNIQPGYYTFDLSFGYNTMDLPANEYLRNIGVQLVIQNILDKHGSYQYRISTGGGNPCTCDLQFPQTGRLITLILTKEW